MKSSSITAALTQFMLLQEASSFGILTGRQGSIKTTTTTTALSMTLRDQYMQPHFQAPTQPSVDVNDMSHMVECAEGSELCSVEEMTVMVEELDRMNENCKGESSSSSSVTSSNTECDLDTVDARETLRHALESQIELSQARNDMKKMDVIRGWSSSSGKQQSQAATTDAVEDHAFDHFVDYRAIGEYESH